MKRRFIAVGMAIALAGSFGVASANPINLINNGDFSNASPHTNEPTQFGGSVRNNGHDGSGSCTFGGQFISDWTGTSGYELWYPSATAASTVTACNQYNGNTTQRLPAMAPPPTGAGSFVGLDGQSGLEAGIEQSVINLVAGTSYTVSFWWGATEEMSRSCNLPGTAQSSGLPDNCLTENLKASIDGVSNTYSVVDYTQQTFQGWNHESFSFTASSTSAILSFLSMGTPANLPPFAVVSGVSLTQRVPEPSELSLFGAGLLGLGCLTLVARRRAKRDAGNG